MGNKFIDKDTADKVREQQKEEREINKQKAKFNRMNEVGRNLEGSGGYNYDNEALLRAYIGNGYDTIIKRGFNIFAFLLGPFYILYRKMYVYGFGLMVFYFLLFMSSFVLPELWMTIGIFVLIQLVIGGTFNSKYVSYAIDEVNRLKKEYISYDTADLCRSYGGTSIVMAIISSIVFMLIIAFATPWIKKLIK